MKHLTDNELLKQTKILVQKERELLMEVLEHLREISDRKLFSELGYKSLFEFAVKHLGYSEDQSYRRINAMKLVRQVPGLENKIQNGEVHLSHIGIAQNLFQQEAKAANPFSVEQKREVFNKIAGTSSREAEKIAQQMSSRPESLRPEKVKTISETAVSLQITLSSQTLQKIETLKGWLAHRFPGMSTGELFEKLCEVGIKEFNPSKPVHRKPGRGESQQSKQSPSECEQSESPKSASSGNQWSSQNQQMEELQITNSLAASAIDKMNANQWTPPDSPVPDEGNSPEVFRSHLPLKVRRLVFAKAHNQCEKCQSVHFLELDHKVPLALGGTNYPENLRLLCRNCNQRAAINAFGKEKIMSHANKEFSEANNASLLECRYPFNDTPFEVSFQ